MSGLAQTHAHMEAQSTHSTRARPENSPGSEFVADIVQTVVAAKVRSASARPTGTGLCAEAAAREAILCLSDLTHVMKKQNVLRQLSHTVNIKLKITTGHSLRKYDTWQTQ